MTDIKERVNQSLDVLEATELTDEQFDAIEALVDAFEEIEHCAVAAEQRVLDIEIPAVKVLAGVQRALQRVKTPTAIQTAFDDCFEYATTEFGHVLDENRRLREQLDEQANALNGGSTKRMFRHVRDSMGRLCGSVEVEQ